MEPSVLTPSGSNAAIKRPKSSTFEAKRISSFKKQLEVPTSSTNLTAQVKSMDCSILFNFPLFQRVRIDANNRSLDEFGFTATESDNCSSPVISETHLVSLNTSMPIRAFESVKLFIKTSFSKNVLT